MGHGASVLPTVQNATLEDVEKTIKQLSEKQRERVLLALRAAEPSIEESHKEQTDEIESAVARPDDAVSIPTRILYPSPT